MFQYYLILILIEINVSWKFRGFICKDITNQLSDVFTDGKKYVKSQILAANTPIQIEVLEGQLIDIAINEFKTRLKRGRSVSTKDKIPRKRKTQEKQTADLEDAISIKQAT